MPLWRNGERGPATNREVCRFESCQGRDRRPNRCHSNSPPRPAIRQQDAEPEANVARDHVLYTSTAGSATAATRCRARGSGKYCVSPSPAMRSELPTRRPPSATGGAVDDQDWSLDLAALVVIEGTDRMTFAFSMLQRDRCEPGAVQVAALCPVGEPVACARPFLRGDGRGIPWAPARRVAVLWLGHRRREQCTAPRCVMRRCWHVTREGARVRYGDCLH